MSQLSTLESVTLSSACPKCGIAKTSGKFSCCARGGAWFKNCGDVGDARFAHTWTEGIRACKSEFCGLNCGGGIDTSVSNVNTRNFTEVPTTTGLSAVRSSNTCPKCGTVKKSGKFSCCARGGAWFKKCGDADDTKWNHTWIEGIEACKMFLSSDSVESPLQVTLHNVGVIVNPSNTTQSGLSTDQHINIYRPGGMSDTGIAGAENCVGLAKFLTYIYIMSVISLK